MKEGGTVDGDDANLAMRPAHTGLATLQGFRPDVQALRGIAVLAVVLYHANVLLPGGYVGVDVFFVISGFVIGRLLLGEFVRTDRLSLRAFYERRARRLLPALVAMLTVVVLLAPLLAPAAATTVTTRTGISAALFSANAYLYQATSGGYFAPRSEFNPLLHMWSLSVEEKFYFVLPVLLFMAWWFGVRRGNPVRTFRALTAGVFVLSLGACILLSYTDVMGQGNGLRFAFFASVTRAWEFAVGLALVVVPGRWFVRLVPRKVSLATGLLFIGVSMVLFSESTRFPGAVALVPVAGAALVVFGGTSPNTTTLGLTWFNFKPLMRMGDVSYSWYLWHWPLIVFAGAFWPNAGSLPLVAAGAASLIPAQLSVRYLEKTRHNRPERSGLWTVALTVVCLVAPITAAMMAPHIETLISKRVEVSLGLYERADFANGCNNPTPLGARPADTCLWPAQDSQGTVTLIGDSNAGHFAETMIGAAASNDLSLQIANLSGCPFIDAVFESSFTPSGCRNFVESSVRALELDPPRVVVIANGTNVYLGDGPSLTDPLTGQRATTFDGRQLVFEGGLTRVVSRLTAAGSKVVVINVVPTPGDRDPRRCSRLLLLTDVSRCVPTFRPSEDAVLLASNRLEDRAAARGGASIWNFNGELCPSDVCIGERANSLVWIDSGHISVVASKALAASASRYLAEEVNP